MTNSQRLAKVRRRLIEWLAENREAEAQSSGSHEEATADSNPIERESILIREEFFCGRRFYTASHQAVWFIEEDELKIYQNEGNLICTLQGSEIDDLSRAEEPEAAPDILRLPTADESAPVAGSAPAAESDHESEPPARRAA